MKRIFSIIFGLCLCLSVHAQKDSLKILLTADSLYSAFDRAWWKYSLVDDSAVAVPAYNDSSWKYIRSGQIDSNNFKGIGWFRLRFNIDSSLVHKPIAFSVRQKGASEIYLDGKKIKSYGVIKGKDSTEYYNPQNVPIIIFMDSVGEHVLAIRYARYTFRDNQYAGFSVEMSPADTTIEQKRVNDVVITVFLIILFVVFFTLSFLHFLFFLYYKQNVSNLWFSIFMFCISGIWFANFWALFTSDPDFNDSLKDSIVVFASVACSAFVLFIHILFNNKGRWWTIIAFLLSAGTLVVYYTKALEMGVVLFVMLGYVAVYSIICLLRAIIKKIKGAVILGVGFGFFMVSLFCVVLLSIVMKGLEFNTSNSILGAILAIVLLLDIVCIPITMSVYQAWMFAKLNKDLTSQLQHVKELSETSIQQEQEKKHILENQKAQLENMVAERTAQLTLEKHKSDELLLNILPEGVAEELKNTGSAEAKQYNHVSVLFTDFVNFTGLSERMTPTELVQEIHRNFTAFDAIIEKHGLEKIKTIGDAYMAVCGLPNEMPDHAQRVVKAALDILNYMEHSGSTFQIRMGIHSGDVVAGIVGVKKYAYDIWGDAVNTAARMEQNSETGKINISGSTYELVKREFNCVHRGKIEAKNKGEIDMYFVEG
ncbi:MAG: adenylate/guanylate cyclase domain-containing protein [Bacteroidota bacterium]